MLVITSRIPDRSRRKGVMTCSSTLDDVVALNGISVDTGDPFTGEGAVLEGEDPPTSTTRPLRNQSLITLFLCIYPKKKKLLGNSALLADRRLRPRDAHYTF